jgi:SAM-dependent methyltransferase
MTAAPRSTPCAVCGATAWTQLPDPGPQSMASDWRVVTEPLARHACDVCGLARRWPGAAASDALYASGYELYAHAPGEARERARQEQYAAWIAEAMATAPAQVLDVGCGNGSLLRALAGRWPEARLLGCDPSAESVAHGAGADLRLWQGTASNLPSGAVSDLVVSVNVIEHTHDPLAFLGELRGATAGGGTLVIVCPDGSRPNLELLFADHVFSFAPAHLRALCRRAGMEVVATGPAPGDLGPFQMVVARPAAQAPPAGAPPAHPAVPAGRAAYLAAWAALDDALLVRTGEAIVCFGAGEAAGLLRAYVPRTWARVRACTIDGQASGRFGALQIVPLDEVDRDATLLVGVRPLDQPRVAERLRRRFPRVATWYDLLDGGEGGW